ncbi:MAG: Asp-tRNA(Asn)/Glu-tRNA(Gln) amidotransferase subunit GatC [Bacilli bacterium]|nr:Asp-tRNA(Asn)/Glu-tRNA(Gln) amidotransferase subunit GatC [Bacilli bacterium]
METEVTKEKLKDYASKLMFDMEDSEYETLAEEFKILLKQMDVIGNIENIKDVEPMTFPFKNFDATLREDEVGDYLTVSEVLQNSKHEVNDQVKVPRVVDED